MFTWVGPHLQQFIRRVACDRAKGEKRCGKMSLTSLAVVSALESVGIKKTWVDCSSLIQMLNLDTSFVKGDYIYQVQRLEFKQVKKIYHYFDGENKARQTGTAFFLHFRLLKETPRLLPMD